MRGAPDSLPSGTVTFVFTDIAGSTAMLQRLGDMRYGRALDDHRRLLRAAVAEENGREVDTQGDALFVAFPRAKDALRAVAAAQRAIFRHPWPEGAPLLVRMGVHTDEPSGVDGRYVGMGVHRAARICSAAHGGQTLLSQSTKALVEDDLPEGVTIRDLGPHRLKDLRRPEPIFQLVIEGLPADFPPLRTLSILPNNLPVQLTSFVGRLREMGEVKRLLGEARLLTITGSAGVGKTRLAIQVGADLLEQFPGGTWLVELASLSDPALVPRTVAAALGLREEPGRAMEGTLSDHLRDRRSLLILDNCEHLITSCAQLAETLLRGCVRLCILATSRESLGIQGETTLNLRPLSLPEARTVPVSTTLQESEAVRLFVDRAVASHPGFALTERNAAVVAQVVTELDGTPLCIELAAARVKMLTVEQIGRRLDDRFRLLTGGGRTTVPRHQTLRAALDWSYDLLSNNEQVLLRRLAAFNGGFPLDGAETVCASEAIEWMEVLDLLAHLVDKSLVMVEEREDEARYRLLESVRQYAGQRLTEAGEEEAILRRHRDWCLTFAEAADPELRGLNQRAWLQRLEAEHDNLRAALDWSNRNDDGEATLRLAGALGWFWYVRGYPSEGRRWLEHALSRHGDGSGRVRAKALNRAGLLAWYQGVAGRARTLLEEGLALSREAGERWEVAFALTILGALAYQPGADFAGARKWLEESLTVFRALGDRWGMAFALLVLGRVVLRQGNFPEATTLLEESLGLYRVLGDRLGEAWSVQGLGLAARNRGDLAQALRLYEDSLDLFRELGERAHVAVSLNSLGILARYLGDYDRAAPLHEEALSLFQELHDTAGVGLALNGLGLAALGRGDDRRAAELCQESPIVRQGLGDRRGIAETLEALAAIVARRQNFGRAAHLLGAAEALRETLGAPLPPSDRPEYERVLGAVRSAFDPKAFAEAWSEGRAFSLEEAIGLASQDR
ncbi:MAG TPA: tetratricopeptide repeat protein [bacterium]|jgi:predicted ATPase/class 3 adenylate cyclase|nr:tetratricopeptide repeat protein [bacterium]